MSDWRADLLRRYPELFGRGYPGVGDGWRDLLERALARMAGIVASEHGGRVQISQIKEKFGSLRLYYDESGLSDSASAEIEEAVDLAEAASACTCEKCGREGRLHDTGGWLLTKCRQHAEGEAVPTTPGWENLVVKEGFVDGRFRVTSCRRYDRAKDRFVDAPLPRDLAQEEEQAPDPRQQPP
jgi:hypothetical protein